MLSIIFFGSTGDSVIAAQTLHVHYPLAAVVTQPEKPVGRDKTITKTPLELFATEQKIPCLTFIQDEEHGWNYKHVDDVINSLSSFKPDLFITASYGQKIPGGALALPTYGALNIHPSLLPRWRGADPVPWTILAGDAQTGVTISKMTDTFDSGDIVAQKKIAVTDKDMPDALRTQLFILGSALLVEILPDYIKGKVKPIPQKQEDAVMARKFIRDDGYVPFELMQSALQGIDIQREKRTGLAAESLEPLAQTIARMGRALSPWPGLWTKYLIDGIEKRLKILSCTVRDGKLTIEQVQLEGKNPVDWETFKQAYIA